MKVTAGWELRSAEELMDAVQKRTSRWRHAFEQLWHRSPHGYESRLQEYFTKRTGSAADANDLAQQVAIKVIYQCKTYNPDRPFEPFLWTMAWRTFLSWQEKEHRRRRLLKNLTVAPGPDADPEEQDPDSYLVRLERVREVLEYLPEKQRRVLEASIDGKGDIEIARALGIRRQTVYHLRSRAAARIRDQFEREDWLEDHRNTAVAGLARLSRTQQRIVKLYLSGMSYPEIGGSLRLSTLKAWRLLYKAANRLISNT